MRPLGLSGMRWIGEQLAGRSLAIPSPRREEVLRQVRAILGYGKANHPAPTTLLDLSSRRIVPTLWADESLWRDVARSMGLSPVPPDLPEGDAPPSFIEKCLYRNNRVSKSAPMILDLGGIDALIRGQLEVSDEDGPAPAILFDGPWPGGNPLSITSDVIAKSEEVYSGRRLAVILLPGEDAIIGVTTFQYWDGSWGLELVRTDNPSLVPKPSRWDYLIAGWTRPEGRLRSFNLPEFGLPSLTPQLCRDIREDPEKWSITRRKIEDMIRNHPDSAPFHERSARIPALRQWLEIEDTPVLLEVPVSEIRSCMMEVYLRAVEHFRELSHLPEGSNFPAIGSRSLFNPRGLPTRLPTGVQPDFHWGSDDGVKLYADDIERMWREGLIDEEEMVGRQKALRPCWAIAKDFAFLGGVAGEKIPVRISLWRRHPAIDRGAPLSEGASRDLSLQVVVATLPNGIVVGGRVFRLMLTHHEDGAHLLWSGLSSVFAHWRPPAVQDQISLFSASLMDHLALAGFYGGLSSPVEALGWNTSSFYPVTSPPGMSALMAHLEEKRRHPAEDRFPLGVGSYEALRPVEEGKILISPWLKTGNFLPLEIDPTPKADPNAYLWGYSTDTGRSVDLSLGEKGYETPDGTVWYHLNLVGVGRTHKARSGKEARDGLLPLDGAMRRFYLTNLMHRVAGRFGFRTSLGVGVLDRGRNREGHERRKGVPQVEGSIHELRREQFRLSDLRTLLLGGDIDQAVTSAGVLRKVARELGREKVSYEEYVRWLAKTLGKQFAIMEFFGFDHGVYKETRDEQGVPQLHSANVSLLGEIFDFDVGRIGGDGIEGRYVANTGVDDDYVDLAHILEMERKWRIHLDFGEAKRFNQNWLSALLSRARDFSFHGLVLRAAQVKHRELARSGVNPRLEFRRFNEMVWNPFMKRRPWRVI